MGHADPTQFPHGRIAKQTLNRSAFDLTLAHFCPRVKIHDPIRVKRYNFNPETDAVGAAQGTGQGPALGRTKPLPLRESCFLERLLVIH